MSSFRHRLRSSKRQNDCGGHGNIYNALSGFPPEMLDFCLRVPTDYDETGWTVPHLHNPDDFNGLDGLEKKLILND